MHPQKTLMVKFQNVNKKVTKMSKTVKETMDRWILLLKFPIRPLEVNAVKLVILISAAELQNLHVAGTEFLTQNIHDTG